MSWDWDKLQEKRQRQGKPNQGQDKKPVGDLFSKIPKPNKNLPLPKAYFIPLVILGLILLWLATGIFIIKPGFEGVVTRFGKYEGTVGVGPHYVWPYPIESIIKINTQIVRSVDIGVASEELKHSSPERSAQACMFTGDENIVYIHFTVHYSISNSKNFLFNVNDPIKLIGNASEAAMREVIGSKKLEQILTQKKEEIARETMGIIKKVLADYDMGVDVHAVQLTDAYPPLEVRDAFIGVSSAREEKNTLENQAEEYRTKTISLASGAAQQIINEAHSYSVLVSQRADGDAERLSVLLSEFSKTKEATKKRLYLEGMLDVLSSSGVEKVIISGNVGGNILNMLNLSDGKLAPSSGAIQPKNYIENTSSNSSNSGSSNLGSGK